jgi:hypothetical protein
MAAFIDWREPVRRIALRTSVAPSEHYLRVQAATLGVVLRGDEPVAVLTAIVKECGDRRYRTRNSRLPSPAQLHELALIGPPGLVTPELSRRVASAWLTHHRAARSALSLYELQLRAGDLVIASVTFPVGPGEHQIDPGGEIVASINDQGRVFFRGGNGQYLWPYQLARPRDVADVDPRRADSDSRL